MPWEPISPELALVDPELGARARAALPGPATSTAWTRRPTAASLPAPASAQARDHRAYPFWARVTAALWLVVLGILVGGAAIPHAQDRPRLVPASQDATFCKAPAPKPPATPPSRPGP